MTTELRYADGCVGEHRPDGNSICVEWVARHNGLDSYAHQREASDSFGCASVTDFRLKGGVMVLTRCARREGHVGKHNNPSTKSWKDNQTAWLVSPPASIGS